MFVLHVLRVTVVVRTKFSARTVTREYSEVVSSKPSWVRILVKKKRRWWIFLPQVFPESC